MKKEILAVGKTVEAALASAEKQLGVGADSLKYEVITMPKKGFLGIGEVPAKIKVSYEVSSKEAALEFVNKLLKNMEIVAEVTAADGDDCINIEINGGECATLIGHHGETLDQLQYLTNLAANRREDEDEKNYVKINIDIENYRAKREEALRALARRMANKVLKYKKNVALEPMSSYERRIIHSEIQGIQGVVTSSVGQENNRRVIIIFEK